VKSRLAPESFLVRIGAREPKSNGSFLFEGGNTTEGLQAANPALGEEDGMSTLAVVESILREAAMPLSVREIVERAGDALPTKSKTPDTVVARDLSMDIKKKAEGSLFVRTSPGRYAIRGEQAQTIEAQPVAAPLSSVSAPSVQTPVAIPSPASSSLVESGPTSMVGQSLPHDRNGARPATTKTQSNSEDTPMSA
jgi:hypothetical protein